MTPEDLDAALARGAWSAKATTPTPVEPVSAVLGCSDAHALEMARAKRLIGDDGILRCWHCGEPTDWHVSLHCAPCRVTAPARKRERDELERERQRLAREQLAPQAAVGGRRFRDGY